MARYASTHADTDAVCSWAGRMNDTPQGERQLMTELFAARGATPPPMT